MSFIQIPPEQAGDALIAELFADDQRSFGYVANYTTLFAHRPKVYLAWEQLKEAIKANMDLRRYELATLAAARRLRSSYCSLAHGQKVLAAGILDAGQLRDVMTDHDAAGLDEVEVAVMDLADKVVTDATSVTEKDVDRLRDLGCTDADILDVILTTALRCFFSKVLDATGTHPDPTFRTNPALAEPPDLLLALTLGRPIAEA